MIMSAYIVDRRFGQKNKSAVNRERFIERFKAHIKKAVSDAILKRSLSEIEKGEKILIPSKEISEPQFRFGKGGSKEMVFPYNKNYIQNDKIKKPISGNSEGLGSSAGNSEATGVDDFGFEISREEFLNIFFEDLALPDLVKKRLAQNKVVTVVRAGYKKLGSPSLLSVKKSMLNAFARRIAFSTRDKEELFHIQKKIDEFDLFNKQLNRSNNDIDPEMEKLILRKKQLENKLKKVPFIDTTDLRFHHLTQQTKPNTQAVMFCLMDVSGSMDESRKELAKRFFILLYLFLTHTYQKIELVFIRHHTSAKEVQEQEFFYSKETGGTVVSSAIELMSQIIFQRYPPSEWNIYGAQASDGDNWHSDSPRCADLLMTQIMPYLQYFAYIEILGQTHQNLWENYLEVANVYKNFAMKSVDNPQDIYPVFHELFQKKSG